MTLIDLVAAEYVVRRVLLPGLNLMMMHHLCSIRGLAWRARPSLYRGLYVICKQALKSPVGSTL